MKHKAFDTLLEISKKGFLLGSIHSLLDWDQETYMPEKGISVRSLQTELMASLIHKASTSRPFEKALAALINLETGAILDPSLNEVQKAALQEWRKDFVKAKKLSNAFVKSFAKTASQAQHAWSQARKNNSFKAFAPHLEKIVKLCRKKGTLLGYEEHPYDALLDLYEPGMKTSFLEPLFARLRKPLTELLKEITASPLPKTDFLHKYYAPEKQLEFSQRILEAMGFDKKTSRLDLTVHPFCSGFHPHDTRLTTKVHNEDPLACFLAVIHEGGHGLYNMGLPVEQYGTPLCSHISLGIDESQSRWWETLIGHSLPFWQHFYPILQKTFPENLENVSLQDFYKALNIVQPSLIRIHADEVTYNLHIIIRFEIEKALIEGTLQVKEVPAAWNAKMKEYLGITPPNDANGCLQDIHWSMGGLGYFPTYTLGNLYAAQFFATFEKQHPHWKEEVAKGNLLIMKEWLNANIHKYGRQFSSTEICTKITGKPLTPDPYIHYLQTKYPIR